MKNLFQRTSSHWVRYSEYKWKTAENGTLYLTPTATAQPDIYDPLSEYQQIVLDAINIGRMETQKKTPQEIQKAIQQFAVKYGLLGLMTALPTTPNFMAHPYLQALFADLCGKQTECNLLQPAVQE